MSTVFSRVRDKQYRNVIIYLVLSSIWLIFLLSKLVAAYINRKPAYEELEYIAIGITVAVTLADRIYKFVSP